MHTSKESGTNEYTYAMLYIDKSMVEKVQSGQKKVYTFNASYKAKPSNMHCFKWPAVSKLYKYDSCLGLFTRTMAPQCNTAV